jgi:hypothetical protein
MNPVNRPASGEINQNNDGLRVGKGMSKLCRSEGMSERQ